MYVLGINPDGEYFKVALLSRRRNKIKIIFIQEYQRDFLDLERLKKRIAKETNYSEGKVDVVSALPSDDLFIRHLTLPLKSRSAVLKALPFQMESIIPFSQEHATLFPVLKKGKKETEVTLYSFLNESMHKHLEEIKKLGFDPDGVSSISSALLRFVKLFAPSAASPVVFHFGWEKSHLLLVKEGEVRQAMTLKVGLKKIIDSLKEDDPNLSDIDLNLIKEEVARAPENQGSRVKRAIHEIKTQTHRVMEFSLRKCGVENFGGIVYVGYSEIIGAIHPMASEYPLKPIETTTVLGFDKRQAALFAIEIGLALDALEGDENSQQFRVGRFTAKRQIARIKRKTGLLVGLSLVCTLVATVSLIALRMQKEGQIRDRFNQVVEAAGEKRENYPLMQKRFLTQEDCKKEGKNLLEKFTQMKSEELLFDSPVTVSECIQKIFSVLTNDVTITEIKYELVKYPRLDQLGEKYETKVDLFFQCKDRAKAEEFHAKVVSQVKEILKETELTKGKDGYQITFTL